MALCTRFFDAVEAQKELTGKIQHMCSLSAQDGFWCSFLLEISAFIITLFILINTLDSIDYQRIFKLKLNNTIIFIIYFFLTFCGTLSDYYHHNDIFMVLFKQIDHKSFDFMQDFYNIM